jgi:hypothetical protein
MADEMRECSDCGEKYRLTRDKPGKIDVCGKCGLKAGEVERLGGNMVYTHKTAPALEIKPLSEAEAFARKTRRFGAGVTQSLCESKGRHEKTMFKDGTWMKNEPLKD